MRNDQHLLKKEGVEYILKLITTIIIHAILFFSIANRYNLLRAIIYFSLCFINFGHDFFFFKNTVPLLANKRGTTIKHTWDWDSKLDKFMLLLNYLIFISAAVESRFDTDRNWGSISLLIGILLFILGAFIVKWAMYHNNHFNTTVHIEGTDHAVITGGPYKFIRHPGYLGFCLGYLSIPITFGTTWTMIPALLLVLLFVYLTHLEDSTLKKELSGFSDYAKKVKSKLIPWIW